MHRRTKIICDKCKTISEHYYNLNIEDTFQIENYKICYKCKESLKETLEQE